MKRFKNGFLKLSFEEKAILISGVIIILSAFFPWQITQNPLIREDESINAFGGILSAHGYTVFFAALISVLLVALPFYRISFPRFLPPSYVSHLVLFSVNTLIIFLAILAYIKYSFVDTKSDIGFGIYLSFFSSVGGFVFSFLNYQSKSRKGLIDTKRETRLFKDDTNQKLNL